MITVAPAATFEAITSAFAHSATVGIRIRDNQGADFLARTVTGVTEDLSVGTAAVFRRTCTAPSTAGQYTIVWDNGTTIDTETLTVTYTAVVASTGSIYATRDELKVALELTSQSYADDDIDRAVAAASRAIDNACGRFFYSAADVRYYTPDPWDRALDTIDVQAVTELAVDTSGSGTFATVWVSGVDYDLEPFNAASTGRPYSSVRLRSTGGKTWPPVQRSVRVTGTFGWASIPDPVNQYAIILSSKLLKRTREAPFGILSYGLDQPIATRIARTDPDFNLLLGDYVKATPGF